MAAVLTGRGCQAGMLIVSKLARFMAQCGLNLIVICYFVAIRQFCTVVKAVRSCVSAGRKNWRWNLASNLGLWRKFLEHVSGDEH